MEIAFKIGSASTIYPKRIDRKKSEEINVENTAEDDALNVLGNTANRNLLIVDEDWW